MVEEKSEARGARENKKEGERSNVCCPTANCCSNHPCLWEHGGPWRSWKSHPNGASQKEVRLVRVKEKGAEGTYRDGWQMSRNPRSILASEGWMQYMADPSEWVQAGRDPKPSDWSEAWLWFWWTHFPNKKAGWTSRFLPCPRRCKQCWQIEGRRGWTSRECSIIIYTISGMRWTAGETLLWSTGSPVWCSMVT